MKNNLRRLTAVLKHFQSDSFYTCSISDFEVNLQGRPSANTIKIANKLKFKGSIDMESGHVYLYRGNYKIALL